MDLSFIQKYIPKQFNDFYFEDKFCDFLPFPFNILGYIIWKILEIYRFVKFSITNIVN